MRTPWTRSLWIGILAVLAGVFVSPVTAQEGPTAHEAAAAMGKGFNLGQMFDNDQHPATLETARPKIDAYYARGFRTVRIPVTWTEPVGGSALADPQTGAIDNDVPRLTELKRVVDYALAQPGMHVVLNAHHEVRLKDNARADVLARLWLDIAARFGHHDGRLMFEILNEPHLSNHEAMEPDTLRRLTQAAYERVRAADAQRIILIGGNQWFGAHEMARTWPDLSAVGHGNDAYLMATFHHYSPWTFSGDNQGDYSDPWTDDDIAGPMKTMSDWATTVGGGMPVFIGEWGVGWQSRYATMDCNNIRLWYQRFDAVHARASAMPTAVWDDGGWFELFDHDDARFSNDLIDCIEGDCDADRKPRFGPDCD